MNNKIRLFQSGLAILSIIAFPMLLSSCNGQATAKADPKANGREDTVLTDGPLEPYRLELLSLAYDAASRIQAFPHIKDRSRTQEAVVVLCLKLDQPIRALEYTEGIVNWRRGSCYADLAIYCAQRDLFDRAREYLALADQIAENGLPEGISSGIEIQEWRTDRIRAKMGQVHAWMGNLSQAQQLTENLEDSETGKLESVKVMTSNEDAFDEQIAQLENLVGLGNFDILRNVMQAYSNLYHRFYADSEKRSLLESRIKGAWDPLPIFIRLDILLGLADSALEHSDREKALELIDEAQVFLTDYQWPIEHLIKNTARVTVSRYRAGDTEKARFDLDAALNLYEEQREGIVNIYRARTLHPIAEAYRAMNDIETSLRVYRMSVEEGVVNPNSRPRAEDLSATCRSMALHSVEPDTALWKRMREINNGLYQ